MLPRVTGRKFQKITLVKGTPEPRMGPAVCRNWFTTMCSMPIDWKAVIGSQQARILPGTLLLTRAMVTPRHTSQFATSPRRKARKKPMLPRASYFFSTLI